LSTTNEKRGGHKIAANGFQQVSIFWLRGAKIKYYAIQGSGDEFCFSVSFFRGNFATHLKGITQKQH
jgi:hypothetical protein